MHDSTQKNHQNPSLNMNTLDNTVFLQNSHFSHIKHQQTNNTFVWILP